MSCKYCETKRKQLNKKFITLELFRDGNELNGFCGWCGCCSKIKIKYCPMCGRELVKDEFKKSD